MSANPYISIPELDSVLYTDYFLNEFIPKHGPIERIRTVPNKMYMIDFRDPTFKSDPIIQLLENTLIEKFNFPKICYLMLFHHTFPQRVHLDGHEIPRHVSLNLPLSGFTGTNTTWYSLAAPLESYCNSGKDFDLVKFPESDLTPVCTLPGTNEWSLIHTSVPHQIIGSNYITPRLTLCVRFNDNPSFEYLAKLLSAK